jgi:hypothetical protein
MHGSIQGGGAAILGWAIERDCRGRARAASEQSIYGNRLSCLLARKLDWRMFEIFDRFRREWSHIEEAPWSFIGAMLIAVVATYLVLSLIYSATFSGKDATIQSQKERIEGLNASVADLEKKIAAFANTDIGKANAKADQLQGQVDSLTARLESSNAKGLLIGCDVGQLPREIPTSGRVYIAYVFSPAQPVVLGEQFGPVGNPMPKMNPLNSVQCILTNYSSDTLLNVEVPVVVDFLKTEKTADGALRSKDSDVIKQAKILGEIPKIDSGTDKSFTFYVFNIGTDSVNLRFPVATSAKHLQSTERFTIPISSSNERIYMSPKFDDVK